jgi:hypothetical protein
VPHRQPSPTYIKVYDDLVTTGLLAKLTGSELKLLLALASKGKVLSTCIGQACSERSVAACSERSVAACAEAERHFQSLRDHGVVTAADRGRLFCYLDRDTLAALTGLNAKTVSRACNGLVAKKLVEKRSVRSRRGRHRYNVYFIQPASHLARFDFNRRSASTGPAASSPEFPRAPTSSPEPPSPTMGQKPPPVDAPYVKNGCGSGGLDPDAQVFAAFAQGQAASHYQPTTRDLGGLARVRAEGYTQDQILTAITQAFDSRRADAGPIQRFTYCLPIIRSGTPSDQQPQPVPSGSPVATPLAEEPEQDAACLPAIRAGDSSAQQPQPVPPGSPVATPLAEELDQDRTDSTASPESRASPGANPRDGPDDGWQPAMDRVYEELHKVGWPLDDDLKRALAAKAQRVDDDARQQGASGPAWVAEAMLITLGRKVCHSRSQAPAPEDLLAYADGVLDHWLCQGHPLPRQPAPPARASPQTASCPAGHGPSPSSAGSHPDRQPEGGVHPEPKSEEEQLWDQVLADLQLRMSRATFDQWLRGSRIVDMHRPAHGRARLVVAARSPLAVEWLEHRMKRTIQRAVKRQLKQKAEITFQPPQAGCAAPDPDIEPPKKDPDAQQENS